MEKIIQPTLPAQELSERDLNLTRRIRERLNWDKRVGPMDVFIHVKLARVTLVGRVDCPAKRAAATEIAQSTRGVKHVDNQIEVPMYFDRSDSEIERLLRERMGELALAGGEYVTVDVRKGAVKLQGFVSHRSKKSLAAGMAWELSGVTDLENHISIDPGLNLRASAGASKTPVAQPNQEKSQRLTAGFTPWSPSPAVV